MLKRRIMIVDDHPMFRIGLRRLLESDPRLAVVAEAENGHQALHQADIHKPSVVLMDVQLPGVTGIHVASALRRERAARATTGWSARCATWRPSGSRAGPIPAATSTAWEGRSTRC